MKSVFHYRFNSNKNTRMFRAGPGRCGAQCKTQARGPSEQWFYDVIVFSQPCYTTMVGRTYKTLAQELSTFANV